MREGFVEILEPHGFCLGVKAAVARAEEALATARGDPLWCLHGLVHNDAVVSGLVARGMRVVESLEDVPKGARVLFSAHGVSPRVREEAERRQLRVVDATCPFVVRVHRQVRDFAARGISVVILGHADHVEVKGVLGEAHDIAVVANPEDVARLPFDINQPVGIVSQTTLAAETVQTLMAALRARYVRLEEPQSADVCSATRDRQSAVRAFVQRIRAAGKPVGVLVLGSPHSSNTRRLAEVAENAGARAWRVAGAGELPAIASALAELEKAGGVLGITAGASTPESGLQEVLRALGLLTRDGDGYFDMKSKER